METDIPKMAAGSPAPKGSELRHSDALPRETGLSGAEGQRGRPCRRLQDAARAGCALVGLSTPAAILPPLSPAAAGRPSRSESSVGGL